MLELIAPGVSSPERSVLQHPADALCERFAALDAASRNRRARDLAAHLGCTEAQWVAAQCGDLRSVPLAVRPAEIFSRLGRLGALMALTRNDFCVHERHGEYLNVKATEPVGLVLGPDIDLRMFFSFWDIAWAVEEKGRCSLQFFDKEGVAVHKVYCTAQTDMQAYRSLVDECAMQASAWPTPTHYPHELETTSIADIRALREAWFGMGDPHDFAPLLRRLGVSRADAIRSAGPDLAQCVASDAVESMLTAVAQSGLRIMCFVSNRGMVQVHTGPVNRIHRTGRWLNIADPTFSLHLDTSGVASTWVVNKPSGDGWITSLESYSNSGELIVQFFGARKPGDPELTEWRAFLQGMCEVPLAQ